MKYISEQEFELLESVKLSDYTAREIQKQKDLQQQVNPFCPAKLVFCMSEITRGEGKGEFTHFERSEVILIHPNLDFSISYNTQSKKYHIACYSLNNIQPIGSGDKHDARTTYTEPQRIGVLTTKKIKEWVKFYEDQRDFLEVKAAKNLQMQQNFKNTLLHLPVIWQDEKETAGRIEKNGIAFNFCIEPSYINADIFLDNDIEDTLENFLKLSNNKFK